MSPDGSPLSRMPLRFKLTLAFTGVMAVLLAIAGFALSLLVAQNLDSTIDDGLAARARDAAAVVDGQALASTGEPYAQVLNLDGSVDSTTTGAGEQPLITSTEVERARAADVIVERRRGSEDLRLLARTVRSDGRPALLVVGESLAQRERALGSLHALLLVGGPLALLIASVIGYAIASAALRPVERMRRHAEAVTAAQTSERLPVPPGNDEIARLGRTLNEMLARLEVAFKRERAFVSDASHELRTPLAILRTELELALRGEHTREELEDALRSAAEESERLSQLADDLLVIARSDQGRLPVRPELIDAGAMLARVAGRFRTRARAEGRPLAPDPSPGVRAQRRSGADGAGAGEPRGQRAPPRPGHRAPERARGRRPHRAARARRGQGVPAGLPATRVRALHESRRSAYPRRDRAGSGDRLGHRDRAWRQRSRDEPENRR